jgi:hypothetical protein
MYALWKSQGVSARPWRPDLRLGAVRQGDTLFIAVEADSAWSGTLRFDVPRSREILHLPADWPRINSFPEWYTVDRRMGYRVVDAGTGRASAATGEALASGMAVTVAPGRATRLIVTRTAVLPGER